MAKLRGLMVLMLFVVLVITCFQLYWLKDNYARERASLHIKADDMFQQVITRLEDSLLRNKIGVAIKDSLKFKVRSDRPEESAEDADSINIEYRNFDNAKSASFKPRDSSRNVFLNMDSGATENLKEIMLLKKLEQDSTQMEGGLTRNRIRILSQTTNGLQPGLRSTSKGALYFINGTNDKVRISIDSLFSDSISVQLIERSFGERLAKSNIGISYSVSSNPSNKTINLAPAGGLSFMRALRYNYHFKSERTYLIQRIGMPILFSFFLIGLTILSFILLYRTLLQQQRLAQSRSDLVSNITHELKTPIATVSVAIEALKNFSAINNREKTDEYLNISQQELQRLDLLVDKVLKLSMFESKELHLNKQHIDIGSLAREVSNSLRLQLENFGTKLEIEKDGSLEMNGDRQHLQSVIFNLLDNSLKYNEGKALEIKIVIKGTIDRIDLSVSDNGVGIAEAYHDKIFEKFFRVPTGDTHNAKGHGLGLSYVASVVKQHGGNISLQSASGMGTTFIISLPKHLHASH